MTRPQHIPLPDIAKGIGIILVVFGHVWRGLAEAGLLQKGAVFETVDAAVYAFHMPLFFVLSGWFFPQLLTRGTAVTFVGRISQRLFYPLCLWTYIFIAFKVLAGSAANSPLGLDAFLRWPVPGYLHLWFLWALIVLQLGGLLMRPLVRRWPVFVALGGMAAAMTVLQSGLWLSPLWHQALKMAPYFFGGMVLGQFKWPQITGGLWVGLGVFVISDIGLILDVAPRGFAQSSLTVSCVGGLLFALHHLRSERPIWAGVQRIGQCSLAIYLCHTILSAGWRIGLVQLGITAVPIHLITGVGIGVLMPMLWHHHKVSPKIRLVFFGQA
ncbi:acyltransferase family protein [Aestuariibius sp. HNIBRBA575]|uniref:acyltransferase family protein n=1 Tax=Aestuariibius sp. HNIBRBA575 TaxID=3233343 RepID=UPI0034A37C03